MSITLLQIALLVSAIGALILTIRIVRSSPTGDLARPLRFLHWGFWGCMLSFALAMGVDRLAASDARADLPDVATNVLLAAFYICACVYWTAIGVLAHRSGRSWILWVVVGLVTLAVGFIVSYALMASRVRTELTRRA